MEFNLSALGSAPAAEETYDVVIIGGGPAGLTAGIYAGRAQLKTVIVEKGLPGGQIAQTDEVENYPGFPEGISGPELASRMVRQAEKFGARIVMDEVLGLEKAEGGYLVRGYERNYRARAVIVATGANPRRLGVPGEDKFYGRGVSTCATCDGFFYRGKEIMVIGGGDTAMEEANFLTRFGSRVTLVHRRDEFRASKIMLDRAKANPKIEMILNTVVDDIYDVTKGEVTGVRLRNVVTGEAYDRPVDGFFVAIGHIPNTKFLGNQITLDEDGYIISQGGARTNIPGVFHAGDVQDRVYRQAITASGAGCMAAIEAERFLENEGH